MSPDLIYAELPTRRNVESKSIESATLGFSCRSLHDSGKLQLFETINLSNRLYHTITIRGREDKQHLVQLRALGWKLFEEVASSEQEVAIYLIPSTVTRSTSDFILQACALCVIITVICVRWYKLGRLSAFGRRSGKQSYQTVIIYWIVLSHLLDAVWACNRISDD